MIKVKDKSRCCGCEACVSSCPVQCIDLVMDKEGFLYCGWIREEVEFGSNNAIKYQTELGNLG